MKIRFGLLSQWTFPMVETYQAAKRTFSNKGLHNGVFIGTMDPQRTIVLAAGEARQALPDALKAKYHQQQDTFTRNWGKPQIEQATTVSHHQPTEGHLITTSDGLVVLLPDPHGDRLPTHFSPQTGQCLSNGSTSRVYAQAS